MLKYLEKVTFYVLLVKMQILILFFKSEGWKALIHMKFIISTWDIPFLIVWYERKLFLCSKLKLWSFINIIYFIVTILMSVHQTVYGGF
jgi:hypothetical protein